MAARGAMSGPMSREVVSCVLSLISPPVRDRQAMEVSFEMDFAGKSATRTPERLILLPPFCPGSGDVRANDGTVEHLAQMRGFAGLGQELEERLDDTGSAEPPEALPDSVPRAERGGERAPGQIRDREKSVGPSGTCDHAVRVGHDAIERQRRPSTRSSSRLRSFQSAQPAILVAGLP